MIPSDACQKQIKNVKRWPKKAGKTDLLRFLRGERLTRAESIRARCYECVCGEDTEPCNVEICPLRTYCQWGEDKPGRLSQVSM